MDKINQQQCKFPVYNILNRFKINIINSQKNFANSQLRYLIHYLVSISSRALLKNPPNVQFLFNSDIFLLMAINQMKPYKKHRISVQRTKRQAEEKFNRQMDQLQQQFYQQNSSQPKEKGKKSKKIHKSTYKKPDPKKKVSQIRAYEEALKEHRKTCSQFIDPFSVKRLKLNIAEAQMIKLAQQGMQCESKAPEVLRRIGFKRLKIICKGVARQHFQSIINYLRTGDIPMWMKNKYEELLARKE